MESWGKALEGAVNALGEGADALISGYTSPPRTVRQVRQSRGPLREGEIEALAKALSEEYDAQSLATLDALDGEAAAVAQTSAALMRRGRGPTRALPRDDGRGAEDGGQGVHDKDRRRHALVRRGAVLFADGAPSAAGMREDAALVAAAWEEDLNVSTVAAMSEGDFARRVASAQALPVWESIQRDVHRTLPRHADFAGEGSRGRRALQRLLAVYATLDTDVGYVQGMNFVAAVVLTTVDCDERRALRIFRAAMTDPRLRIRRLYLPSLPGLHTAMASIERYMREQVPDLAEHFERLGVHPMLYACEWVLTLFAYIFPAHIARRVLALLFMDGWHAIGGVAVAFLLRFKRALLAQPDMEGCLTVLKSVHRERDCTEASDGTADTWLKLEHDIVEAAVDIYSPSYDFERIK